MRKNSPHIILSASTVYLNIPHKVHAVFYPELYNFAHISNKLMHRLIQLLALLTAFASTTHIKAVNIGPLSYSLDSPIQGEASVNGLSSSDNNTQTLIIPDEVTVDGNKYTVTRIAANAFADTELPEKIIIPESVTTIEQYAFKNTSHLTGIIIDDGNLLELSDYAFSDCSLSNIKLPRNLKTIGKYTFNNCINLHDIDLCEVKTIGDYAFAGCSSLTSITLPPTVVYLGHVAFPYIQEVYFKANTPILYPDIFPDGITYIMECPDPPVVKAMNLESIPQSGKLYVPTGTFNRYGTSAGSAYASAYCSVGNTQTTFYWKNMDIRGYDNSVRLTINGSGHVYLRQVDYYPDTPWELKTGDQIFSSDRLLIMPDENYHLISVTIDGRPSDMSPIETLKSINYYKNSSVEITFAQVDESLSAERARITVKGNDMHTHTHTYPEGHSASIDISPEEGWHIHMVRYNGKNVTSQLKDNTYTTSPLHGENLLEIIFVDNQLTSIQSPDLSDNIDIRTANGQIEVYGTKPDTLIQIYDVTGTRVYCGKDTIIRLDPNIYLMSINGVTYKFAL